MIFNCGAQRHPYSMFDVGRSMFGVQFAINMVSLKCANEIKKH